MPDKIQPTGLSASEELLARTFDHWREEFRSILESHRREIQDRLEKIEREIEKNRTRKTSKCWFVPFIRIYIGTLRRLTDCTPVLAPKWGLKPCGRLSA